MASTNKEMAPSPRQALGSQGVRRIPARRTHPKVENKTKARIRIGTWNVRSLYMAGKLDNAIKEMKRLKVDILGVSEVRWPNSGRIQSNSYTVYYSGNDLQQHSNGVAVILSQSIDKSVVTFVPHSDRAMLIKLKSHPVDINLIQVYAPTADKTDMDIRNFYNDIKELLRHTKPSEVIIIMGDFNAKIGKGEVENVVGKYGLGERNTRGDILVQFCQEENLAIANTWFQLPSRRLYTWQSPQHNENNTVRNQIDFILINHRYRNGIQGVKAYPGADINSDHNPLIGNLHVKLKRLQKPSATSVDIQNLKNPAILERVRQRVNMEFPQITNISMNDTQEQWNEIQNILSSIEREEIGTKDRRKGKSWMTDEILQLMEERRRHKNKNSRKYREVNREIQRKVRRAKEQWMNERCEEVELLEERNDHFAVHKKVKEVVGRNKKTNTYALLDENNKTVIEVEDIKRHWKSYIEQLFKSIEPRYFELTRDLESSPKILKEEVIKAIKNSKAGKAPGPDQIHIEIIKLLEEEHIDTLVHLFNKVYSTGVIPREWLKSEFIPIPKKSNARRCEEYRLISLMSHLLKLFLKIIHSRIFRKCEQDISQSQFGFREGMGTREALFGLNVLLQKCRDQQRKVYICFIDYEKAFDRVDHVKLLKILEAKGLDKNDITIIKNLYWDQTAVVKYNNTTTEAATIQRGVRQGCVLSPMLFNLYSEAIFEEATKDTSDGIKINGETLNNLRYADDTAIIADSPEALQRLLNQLTAVGDRYGLKINTTKTKILIISKTPEPPVDISIYGKRIDVEEKFKYLGTWITNNLDPEVEIRSRIEQARATFNLMRSLLCSSTLNLKLRYRFVKCYVYSVLLYGCEAWTLKVNTINRIEAFEMWVLRRLLKIPWTAHVTNEDVLRQARCERELVQIVKKRKTAYLGHIMRGRRYELLQLIMEGKIEGKRGIGRKKYSWLKNIRDWTGMDAHSLLRTAQDRQTFAGIVANLQ
ncbi:unnamed protein product [Callosobruchus maculatus]|uniref:Reverse transcriptase domain-containing protein n=1 Tax=Callosobruchus maculatus TaxID=64391 RepID=A0A653DE01_CALMS|nr:unnamed protein product [Callosobruchus maculatus]